MSEAYRAEAQSAFPAPSGKVYARAPSSTHLPSVPEQTPAELTSTALPGPWTPDQPPWTKWRGRRCTSTCPADNLPSYHRAIHAMFGRGNSPVDDLGASLDLRGGPPLHRAAGPSGGHPHEDPGRLEDARMPAVQTGYDRDGRDVLHGHGLRGLPITGRPDLAPQHRPVVG